MDAEPFTRADGPGRYLFNGISRGPWDPNSLHARVLAGLISHEIELAYTGDDFHCARLTIDLYRLPKLTPAEITTRAVRQGGRIRVIEAEYASGGISYARATAVLLKRTENPAGQAWQPPPWNVPGPDDVEAREGVVGFTFPMWETRYITPSRQEVVRQQAWVRETRELVAGVPLTPFVRAASGADFTNPFANWTTEGLQFINADITLYLHRYPQGEWIGFEVASHQSADGIAVGQCTMYDEQGAIGLSTVCAIANRRMP